jgi:hypothetical protein
MEEKVGAVEIEKVAVMDVGNLNETASEDIDEDERTLERKTTYVTYRRRIICISTNIMIAERPTIVSSQSLEVHGPLHAKITSN